MENIEKAEQIALNLVQDGVCYQDYEAQMQEIQSAILKMAEWKDGQMKKTLIDFMHYLDRRDFFHDDLCFDIEHQVETFIELRNREE